MSAKSDIEWTDATWPIVQGCDPVSPGCTHCYAVRLLWRLAHNPNPKISTPLQGLTEKHVNAADEEILRFTGKVALREDRIDDPLHWHEPRMIFVPSHGDIFHKDVPDEFIDKIFARMALCSQHRFQVLTKRAERMREYIAARTREGYLPESIVDAARALNRAADDIRSISWDYPPWPLPNVWLGISCERQEEADERIPLLLQTPAAIRFISAEPLLGPIDLTKVRHQLAGESYEIASVLEGDDGFGLNAARAHLDWVIAGGESGKDARPMHPQWARELRDQCAASGVPYFFKQWGEHRWAESRTVDTALTYIVERVGKKAAGRLLDGREWNEFPGGTDARR